MHDVLRLDGVTYRYPAGARPALADVSLSLAEGELTVLAGVSGSGKSTLMRAACGLVPHFFGGDMAGRVTVCGRDTREHGPAGVADVAAMVFQDPESQVVMNGVRAELELSLESRGHGGAGAARAVEEAALAFGIEDLLERPVAHPVGRGAAARRAGGRARGAARGCCSWTSPRRNSTRSRVKSCLSQLRRLNEEWGTTVLLGEHRLERCLAAADRVIALDDGAVACDESPAAFLEWAARHEPALVPPAARMFSMAGIGPLPVTVKEARAAACATRPRSRAARDGDAPEAGRRARALAGGRVGGVRRRHRLRRRGAARPVPRRGARRDRRPAGPQRGGQEHPAAHGRRRAHAGPRHACGPQERSRCCCRPPPTTSCTSAPATSSLRPRPRRRCASLASRTTRTVIRATCPAAPASGSRSASCSPAVGSEAASRPPWSRWTSPRAAWTRRASAISPSGWGGLRQAGAAVLVATHDVEFAARTARRCVLLGRGRVVADGSTREVLSGGRYFTTEVARVLGPAPQRRAAGGGRAPCCARARRDRACGGARVSWQAGSALVVSLAAAGRDLWYERRRPSAKLVALVAALAALAVAARVLFAAVPNVQGTTDVALLSGYVLGPAPGFMVGALAALASNLFLGQGPWTPWQMVGWGAAGLRRRAARVAGGPPPRPLAAGARCGAGRARVRRLDGPLHAHELRGGDSADGYVAIATLSLPFNIAHAIGNFALCLVFGPAFVRMLERFSRRLHVRWAPVETAARARCSDDHDRAGPALVLGGSAVAMRGAAARCATACVTWSARRTTTAGSAARPAGLEPAGDRLGRAGPGGRGPPPARRAPRRAHADRLHPRAASARCRRPASWSARSSCCAAPASTRGASAGATCLPTCERKRRPDGSFSRALELDRLRDHGSARERPRRALGGGAARGRVAGAAAERRRRLLVCDARRRDLRGRDRRGPAGPGCRRAAPRRAWSTARSPTCAKRRTPTAASASPTGSRSNAQSTSWAVQGMVAAGRAPASFRRDGRSPLALPRVAPAERRQLPLLPLQRTNAGMGDGTGDRRASNARRSRWRSPARKRVRRAKPAAAPAAENPGSEGERDRSAPREAPAACGPTARVTARRTTGRNAHRRHPHRRRTAERLRTPAVNPDWALQPRP